jgi:hypothetical protein
MFGALLRAAPQLLGIPLLAAALAKVVGPMVTFATNGPATQSDMLIVLMTGISDNFVLVGVLALFLTLLARAVIEARTPAGGI